MHYWGRLLHEPFSWCSLNPAWPNTALFGTLVAEGITCALIVYCLIVCSYIFTQIGTSEMCFSVPLRDNHQNGHYPPMPIIDSTSSPGSSGPGHSSLEQGILTKHPNIVVDIVS